MLIEAGFLKMGPQSAGVARMDSGTSSRIENCQIGVFLAYATANGHRLIDRECICRRPGPMIVIFSATHLYLNGRRTKVTDHFSKVPEDAWQRLSCGSGSKGERLYDWGLVTRPTPEDDGFVRGWLIHRSIGNPTDIAHVFTHTTQEASLEKIVQIAGRRWTIEVCFEQAKHLTGLDEYEVRSLLVSRAKHVRFAPGFVEEHEPLRGDAEPPQLP